MFYLLIALVILSLACGFFPHPALAVIFSLLVPAGYLGVVCERASKINWDVSGLRLSITGGFGP